MKNGWIAKGEWFGVEYKDMIYRIVDLEDWVVVGFALTEKEALKKMQARDAEKEQRLQEV